MRIAFLHPHFTYPGGAARVVLELGNRLAARGHEVLVVSQKQERAIIEPYRHLRFHEIPGPLPNSFLHYPLEPLIQRRVSSALDGFQPDVIIPNVAPSQYWGASYKRRRPQMPVLWYCHDLTLLGATRELLRGLPWRVRGPLLLVTGNPLFRAFDKHAVCTMDHILVNSGYVGSFIENTYGCRSHLLQPAVDTEFFSPRGPRQNYLLILSQLTRLKNVELALAAIECCKRELESSGTSVLVVGDGPHRQALESYAERIGVSHLIRFIGRQPQESIPYLYSGARATLFPSTSEPFGLVPLESMACGTPVIAVNRGGPSETVVHEVTGLLTPPDPQALAGAIRRILTDSTEAEALGRAGREHVEKNFSWEQATANLDEFLGMTVSLAPRHGVLRPAN